MQLSSDAKAEQFLKSFWGVRQHLLRHITPIMQEKQGLELAEYFLLKHIATHNNSPGEISQQLYIPPHGISRKLDHLQKKGLISRHLDPQDARKRLLEISPKGRQTLNSAELTMHEEVNKMLGVLSSKELSTLLELLAKLF